MITAAPVDFRAGSFDSVLGPLLGRLETDPGQPAIIINKDDDSEESITVGRLHQEACSYAAGLREAGVKPGEIVVIALRHCPELVFTFWGALCMGAVPSIFLYKSPMSTAASYIDRLKELAQLSGARAIVTQVQPACAIPGCRVLSPEGLKAPPGPYFSAGNREDAAYIQYTSGTTGMSKGVMLSHRAILNCVQALTKQMNLTGSDVLVNWLPLYHDFGLFGGFIAPLFCGFPTVLIAPFKWLRSPSVLLWAIHRHRGTISFLPNSAHHHTVRHTDPGKLTGLRLDSLRYLISGGEPVSHQSQQALLEHLAPLGLKENALTSGYGMAENTLAATLSLPGERSPVDWVSGKEMRVSRRAVPVPPRTEGAVANTGSGVPMEGMEIAIIDADSDDTPRPLPERRIGEIILRSHTLFVGYHGHPDLTGGVLKNGWYHTGDLGYLADGHLYVCGRKKDLIIVGGHNIHPEDIEAAAGLIPGVRSDDTAAFGIMDEDAGTEKIIVVCGLERPVSAETEMEIQRRVRTSIYAQLEVTPAEILLVKRGWVVKTQNGKIARGLNREKYLEHISNGKKGGESA